MKKKLTRLFSVLLAAVLVFGTLPVFASGTDVADPPAGAADQSSVAPEEESAEEQSAEEESVALQSAAVVEDYDMNIFFLDCGRKYYSVESIKSFINNAKLAGFNYIQLAVGNDGLRFLLDDMSLTVEGKTYDSASVTKAIQAGNTSYNATFKAENGHSTYNPDKNELTQDEMNTIIAYAHEIDMGVIPCVNTPGHMDAILDAAEELTDKTCSYNGSARTIDVTNSTAVAFTRALLQKYITYFAAQGCQYFNMGADEYANDKYTSGSMGFGNLQSTGKYSSYVTYVNQVAALIKNANMTPMAFNDGIYFNNNTTSGTFDTNIVICYWSNGWEGYTPMPASDLASRGFKLINTHGDYYWVLGKSNWQCNAEKAEGFSYTAFQGSDIDNPAGSMFCVWADYPGDLTEAQVLSNTAATITAFGGACPKVNATTETTNLAVSAGEKALKVEGSTTLAATGATSEDTTWTVSNTSVITLEAVTEENEIAAAAADTVIGKTVTATAVGAGTATVTAKSGVYEASVTLTVSGTSTEDTQETQTVTLTAGGTRTFTVNGEVTVSTQPDTNVATVATKVEDGKSEEYVQAEFAADTSYSYLSTSSSGEVSEVSLTIVQSNNKYYLKSGDSYVYPSYRQQELSLGTSKKMDKAVTVSVNDDKSITVSRTSGSTTVYLTLDGNSLSATKYNKKLYLYTKNEVTSGKVTNITFTGVAEGTTTAVVGNTKYNITVSAEDLSKASSLTVEYWITNRTVTANSATSKTIKATDTGVYGVNGAAIADLVPPTGTVNTSDSVVFWKASRLDSNNKQTSRANVDKTMSGADFTYIRYYNSNWAYSSDQENWTNFESTDQVVAYYLQETAVTDEVATKVADWGVERSTRTEDNFVLIDYAVKYDSGTRVPDSFPVEKKTIAFHCSSKDALNETVFEDSGYYYRTIGNILATNSDDYAVYMITLTPSSDDKSAKVGDYANKAASYTYGGTEKVVWVDDEDNLPDEFTADTMKADNYHVGGDAVVPGLKIYNKHAMLVTYYVREIVKESSLTVNYVDESAPDTPFYTYNINVADGTTFNENIGLGNPWKGNLANGSVTNIKNKTQWVTADLTNMSSVDAAKRHSNYKCTRVVGSSDGKTVTLYYTFSNAVNFVIDFGTPLTFGVDDITENTSGTNITAVTVNSKNVTTGTVVANSDKTVTFTPGKEFAASKTGETFMVTLSGTQTFKDDEGVVQTSEGEVVYTVHVYPASNVLYEEGFLSEGAKPTNAQDAEWSMSSATTTPQQTQKASETGKYVFGFDETYTSSTGANGTWSISGLEVNKLYTPLTTTFYGNTFDLIGTCANNTGRIMLVFKNADGNYERVVNILDTRYTRGTIGQVPLAHVVLGEEDAEHTVLIYASGLAAVEETTNETKLAAAASLTDEDVQEDEFLAAVLAENDIDLSEVEYVETTVMDELENSPNAASLYSTMLTDDGSGTTTGTSALPAGTHVDIDGFRVYRTTSSDDTVAQNYPENEQDIVYKNILDVVGETVTAFVDTTEGVVTDFSVNEYEAAGGPQNEIYLSENQFVMVQLKDENGDAIKEPVQISLRAVDGETSWSTSENSEVTTITSNTEMYYEVTPTKEGVVTIVHKGENLLALGNVKFADSTQVTTVNDMSEELVYASLRAAYGVKETETFTPDTFKVNTSKVSLSRNKVITLKINVSSDVAYITVDGVKYTRSGLQGPFQKNRTIRVVKTASKNAEKTYEIIAYNSDGVASEPTTVTVK